MKYFHGIVLLLTTMAAPVLSADQAHNDIIAGLQKLLPEVQIDSIQPTPIQDIYQVLMGVDVLYISGNGRFAFQGELFDLNSRDNLTESVRSSARAGVLQQLSRDDYIEFAPDEPDHVIYAFTDIDCGYCQKLHWDVPELNKGGIAVRYLAYPRAGPNSDTGREMGAVWCAADRQQAMTDAKNNQKFAQQQCDHPVAEQYVLGQTLGVRGTPAIYLQDGRNLPGYMPPQELIDQARR